MVDIYNKFPIFFNDKFPVNYINNIEGWGILKNDLHSKLDDGTYKLLTLDIDVGDRCSLNCPHCFKKGFANNISKPGKNLNIKNLLEIIKEAKNLGLQSIKILGGGEPFENDEFLPFLRTVSSLNIDIVIFTKGHVLGSDELADKYNHRYGISTAEQLVNELFKLRISIMLGFNSFNKEQQLKFVGMPSTSTFDYFNYRNKALQFLVDAGFNQYIKGKPTRLALIAAPFKSENIDEIYEIYKWGRIRNIYVATCPTTVSGDGKKEITNIKEHGIKEFIQKSIDLYTKIYLWSIDKNIMTLESFKENGVSLYPGVHPCNQTAAGFYILVDGKVVICPGSDSNDAVIDYDIRNKSLKEIWIKSINYTYATKEDNFNFYCVAREKELFNQDNFFKPIYSNVIKHFNKE